MKKIKMLKESLSESDKKELVRKIQKDIITSGNKNLIFDFYKSMYEEYPEHPQKRALTEKIFQKLDKNLRQNFSKDLILRNLYGAIDLCNTYNPFTKDGYRQVKTSH